MTPPMKQRHLFPPSFVLVVLVVCSSPLSHAADEMDRYLSVPGSYVFVRTAPENLASGQVTLTVFEDFLCPACYHTVSRIVPKLQKKYGKRLKVEFLGFPFVSPKSYIPARAYVLADEFGLKKEMQEALFHVQFEEQLDISQREGLARVADKIGLDPELLLTRLQGPDGEKEVDQIITRGRSYNLESVPGLVLDGWIKITALSEGNLEAVINGIMNIRKIRRK